MTENLLSSYITPTETASYYNLLAIGAIGGLGVLVLSELIKNKTSVPTKQIYFWTAIYGLVAAASVYDIYKSALPK